MSVSRWTITQRSCVVKSSCTLSRVQAVKVERKSLILWREEESSVVSVVIRLTTLPFANQ